VLRQGLLRADVATAMMASTDDWRVTLNQVFAGAAPHVVIILLVTILRIVFQGLTLVFA
jgi:TRAP-type mannitol/chloroaromatic compound transport system permease large subunit